MRKLVTYINHKYILIVLLLGFVPLTWFRPGYLIRSEEVGYINYTNLLSKYVSAWSDHSSNGGPVSYSNQLAIFPIGLIYKLFDLVGCSPLTTQYVVVVLYFQVTLLSMYLLTRYLTKNSLVALYASIFYGFTFYNLSTFFYTSKMVQTAITPLLFYIFYKFLVTRQARYIFYNFLLLVSCVGLFTNPANGVLTLLVYPICLFYYLLDQKELKKLDFLVRVSGFFLPILPIFVYIFLVYYYSILAPGLYAGIREGNAFAHSFLYTQIGSLLQNFKGAWWETQAVYNPWISLLSSRLSVFSSLVLTSIMFVGYYTIKHPQEVKRYLFWLLLVLIFIFMAKGSSEPLSFVYPILFKHIPGFFIFRESWAKFSPLLIFCATMAFSFSLVSLVRLRYGKLFMERILWLFFLINALPFFLGGPFSRVTADVKLPKYWEELRSWSASNENVNVLPLPLMYEDQEYYGWYNSRVGNYKGYLPLTLLLSNSVGVRDPVYPTHSKLFRLYNPKLLSLLNIEYILDQRDVINGGLDSLYSVPNLVRDGVLESKPDISFGRVDVYKVTSQYLLPRIVTVGSVFNYMGDIGMTTPALGLPYFPKNGTPVLALNRGNKVVPPNNVIIFPDRIRTVKRDFTVWDDGWAWPVIATTDPASWKYDLVKLKERLVIASTLDPAGKIDVRLWLAAKRAAEISAFDLPSETLERVLDDYRTSLINTFQDLKDIDIPTRDDTFWSMVGKTIMYTKRSNQALLTAGVSEHALAKITTEFDRFTLWVEDAANPTCTDYCFNVVAPTSGLYELLLSRAGFDGIGADAVSVELYDYVEKRRLKVIDSSDDWFRIEPLTLESGKKYKIGFALPDTPNIVGSGEWLVVDYTADAGSLKIEPQTSIPRSVINARATEQENTPKAALYLSDNSVLRKKLSNWLPDRNYEVAFDYYTENGKLGVAIVEDVLNPDYSPLHGNTLDYISTEKKLSYRRELESICDKQGYYLGKCKSHFSDRLTSNYRSTGAHVYIYGYGVDKDKFPEILVDNLTIREVRNPIAFLNHGEALNINAPSVMFTRVSPAKYKVTVAKSDTAYDLVFAQNYNPGWRVYKEVGLDNRSHNNILLNFIYNYLPSISGKNFVGQHYLANGYANAWVLPGSSSGGDLILEYWPQRYFYTVFFVILLLGLFSLSYFCIDSIKVLIGKLKHKHDH